MTENVPSLATKEHPLLSEFIRRLVNIGYIVRSGVLQVATFAKFTISDAESSPRSSSDVTNSQ